jgi:hypothetical protein
MTNLENYSSKMSFMLGSSHILSTLLGSGSKMAKRPGVISDAF